MCLINPPTPSSVMCLRHSCSCQSLLMMQWELRNILVMTSSCYSGLYMGLQIHCAIVITRNTSLHSLLLCLFLPVRPPVSPFRLSQTQLQSQYYPSHKYWICMRNTTLCRVFTFRALQVILRQNVRLSNMRSRTKALCCNCNSILSVQNISVCRLLQY